MSGRAVAVVGKALAFAGDPDQRIRADYEYHPESLGVLDPLLERHFAAVTAAAVAVVLIVDSMG